MSDSILGVQVGAELSRTQRALVYQGRLGDEPVVVKVLRERRATPAEVARFRREHDLLRSLDGTPGVPRPRAFGRDGDRWALVYHDIGGVALDVLARERRLPLVEVLHVAASAADVLARVHAHGLVHRDVKPSNLVFRRANGAVQLIDFGAASRLEAEDARFDTPAVHEGTLAYMAPEQTGRMNRPVDFRSDLYALGATLYQLLVGELPFRTLDPLELVHAHLARVPDAPSARDPRVPAVLSDITLKLLAKDAEDRYPSAGSLRTDLAECLRQLREDRELTPFELARDRRPLRFTLPRRLYGREPEVAALEQALDRAGDGPAALVLLAGYAGVGKTSVVQELFRPLTARRGIFLAGKFDALRRDRPYAPLLDAFRALAQQLLGEGAAQLAAWRERLLGALGGLGQVLVEVLPELGMVLGPQPAVPELPASEAQARFEHVFGLFVGAVARPEHPLALFLDDLQWADPGSLRLLETVLVTPDARHRLVVGAYRDNEVPEGHPLLLARDRLRRRGAVETIALEPLGPAVAERFVADALEAAPEAVRDLAAVAYAKTRGNPFFLRAFLTALHREGLLRAGERWTWDLDAIRAKDITDNVADLMTARLRALPEATREALRVAGALGARFELRALAVATGAPAAAAWRSLWPAVSEGLVLALDDDYRLLATGEPDEADGALADAVTVRCRFAHDRVQEAAYGLTPPGERAALHWALGRRMAAAWGEDPQAPHLFDLVGHLNAGRALARGPERAALAGLNRAAAARARASAAFAAAHEHARVGLELLGDDRWAGAYELALDLTGTAAETAFQTGRFDRMEALFAEGVREARAPLDAQRLQEVRTEALNAQGRPLDALAHALDYLDALGVHIPRSPSLDDVVRALGETEAALAGRSDDDLAGMGDIADPAVRTAVTLICKIYSSAYVASPLVFATVALRQLQLVAAHGNCAVSSLVYAVYGLLLAGLAGAVERGYGFGRLGERALGRPDVARYKAQALHLFNCHTRFWREHLRACADGERQAFRVGLETGEVEFGTYGGHVAAKYAFFQGQDLEGLLEEMAHYTRTMRRVRNDIALHSHLPWHQAASNLAAPGQRPWALLGPLYDHAAVAPELVARNDRMSLSNAATARLVLAVLFGRFDEAAALADEGEPLLDSVLSQFNQPIHHFFAALARLGVAGAPARAAAERSLAQLRRWAEAAPMNFSQKVALLEAELMRVDGDARGARDRYDQAIELAQANEFGLDEAVACEAAGRFLLGCGHALPARHYLRDAREAYQRWGAHGKVAWLEERHPEALPAPDALTSTRGTGRGTAGGPSFDALSVVRASQALSREVQLPALVRALLRALMENAGAERAVLLLERDGQLAVEAEARVGDGEGAAAAAGAHDGGEGLAGLPEAVLNYAVRSRAAVVLEDARASRTFASDPYVRSAGPRSVLCQPVVSLGAVKGVIYLENNLTAGAFSPARADVVGLLASQAAIAIDNARHYATLEDRVRERTAQIEARNRFIQRAFGQYLSDDVVAQLLASERGVEIGGERRTVTVLFTDLRGFTSLCEQHPPELVTGMLNRYLEVMTPLIHRQDGTIDDILGDGMLVIFGAPLYLEDHAARAVRCALEMQRAMSEVDAWNAAHGLPTVALGIGIHTGEAVVGNLGSAQRVKYGAVGRTVNVGARIESITAAGEVLISEATRRAVGRPLRIDSERSFVPKGSAEAMTVYAVGALEGPGGVSLPPPAPERALATPLEVTLYLVEGKALAPEAHRAWVLAASSASVTLRTAAPLGASAAARLVLARAGGAVEEVYGRVVSAEGERYTLRFDRVSEAFGALGG
ncbi:MAG: AAA family ATPase [Deltaproteobacteria bacterium]|nr:AAA family ATPase [Deltaproteobacteria bacterium]